MTLPIIGVLGLGYLGKELLLQYPWNPASWGTRLQPSKTDEIEVQPFHLVTFNWGDSQSWQELPETAEVLVLTIPPVRKDAAEEKERLENWCRWMRQHRPRTEQLVYISSTGVYPNQPGHWDETATEKADTPQGQLRQLTESVLHDHFKTRIVRPGAIYGRHRHIGQRLVEGLPIPKSNQPVHRIHVADLAEITRRAVTDAVFPDIINAIDLEAAPTGEVVDWLLQQDFTDFPSHIEPIHPPGYTSRKHVAIESDRRIDNHRLVSEVGFDFRFPTYREGLRDAYLGLFDEN